MNLSETAKIYLAKKIHRVNDRSITLEDGFTIYLDDDEIEHINSHVEEWTTNQQEDEDSAVQKESYPVGFTQYGEPHKF